MIRVSMEVREESSLSRAMVQAESIREAVNITRRRYPSRDVRVMFPIDPETFFIDDPADGNECVEGLFYELPIHGVLRSL
jgi:hypothetical protein